MRTWILCATLFAAVLPRSAGAQSLPLSESEALARLSAESPRVRALRAGVDVARADVVAAGRWSNPRIGVNRESVAGVTEYLTTISQPLPITGVRRLEMRAASSLVEAAAARVEDDMKRARADLQLAFAQLVSAQARERELTAVRERLRLVADVLAKREAAGDASGFDRLRAEREVVDVDADLSIAFVDRTRAQSALASFFAEPIDPARLVANASTVPPMPLPSVDALVQRAESTRGELVALQNEIDAARWSGLAAGRRSIPEPELIAGTKSSSALGGSFGSVLMVQAAIPFFDRARPEQLLADARARQAEARAAALRISIRAEIEGLRTAVTERRVAAERYRTAVASGADQIERIVQVSYEAGERGILELLDAYRIGASARVRQAALDVAQRQAEIELEFLTGLEIR